MERWLSIRHPSDLHHAMRYAALGSGKRIRPALVYATGAALGVGPEPLDAPACAVELIHAYSLVHDDLPAMDDDALRRGHPTTHRMFGEAMAILAGDALQALAFEILATDSHLTTTAERRLEMVRTIAGAAGGEGMAGGQSIDLAAVGRHLQLEELEDMHLRKTGALIKASVRLGALAQPEADPTLLEPLERYAVAIGLAFQVRDDILDVEGDTDVLGKARGADQAHNKPTYPGLLGMAGAKRRLAELRAEAMTSLEALPANTEPLRLLADFIVARIR